MSIPPSTGDRGGIENGLGSSDDIDDPHGFVQHGGIEHGLESSGGALSGEEDGLEHGLESSDDDGESIEDDGLEHGLGSSDGAGGTVRGVEI